MSEEASYSSAMLSEIGYCRVEALFLTAVSGKGVSSHGYFHPAKVRGTSSDGSESSRQGYCAAAASEPASEPESSQESWRRYFHSEITTGN